MFILYNELKKQLIQFLSVYSGGPYWKILTAKGTNKNSLFTSIHRRPAKPYYKEQHEVYVSVPQALS